MPDTPASLQLDVERLVKNEQITCSQVVRTFGANLRKKMGKERYDASTAMRAEPKDLSKVAERAVNAVLNRKEQLDLGNTILRGMHGAASAALQLGGGDSTLPGKLAGIITNATLGKVEQMVADAGKQELRKLLRSQLDQYEKKLGRAKLDELVEMKDVKAFTDELYSRIDGTFAPAFDQIPPEDHDIVEAFRQKQLASIVTDGVAGILGLQAAQGEELSQLQKSVVGLSYTMYQHAKNTHARLEEIEASQAKMKKGIEGLQAKLGNTERGVAFLRDCMFGKLSPDEQLAALRGGLFSELPAQEQQKMVNDIEQVALQRKVVGKLTEYVSGAKDIANIAQNLGVDPEVVNAITTVANIGENVVSAFSSFASSNYLACISSISNIFGVGGRDIAAERHTEVMRALGAVFGEIKEVQEKLDKLEEKLDSVLQNQAAIYEQILALGQMVAQNHVEMLNQFRSLRKEVLITRELILSDISAEYEAGRRFLYDNPRDHSSLRIIDLANGIFPDHARFEKEYLEGRLSFELCWKRVVEMFADEAKIHSFFHYKSLTRIDDIRDEEKDAIETRADTQYGTLFRLLERRHGGDGKRLRQLLEAARVPVVNIKAVDAKLAAAKTFETASLELTTPTDVLKRRIANLLETHSILRHCDIVGNFHVYHQMIDQRTQQVIELSKLLDAPGHEKGLDELEGALILVDSAILQYTLLGGDVLLPDLYAAFAAKLNGTLRPQDAPLAADVEAALESNPILAANTMLYGICAEVAVSGNFVGYTAALKSSDPQSLRRVLTTRWPLVNASEAVKALPGLPAPKSGWAVKVGRTVVELPGGMELMLGRLMLQPELYGLMETKSFLLDQISSYQVMKKDFPEGRSRKDFNRFLLNAAR